MHLMDEYPSWSNYRLTLASKFLSSVIFHIRKKSRHFLSGWTINLKIHRQMSYQTRVLPDGYVLKRQCSFGPLQTIPVKLPGDLSGKQLVYLNKISIHTWHGKISEQFSFYKKSSILFKCFKMKLSKQPHASKNRYIKGANVQSF